jgi:parvulin-like peptidyl-prolyl isomerase
VSIRADQYQKRVLFERYELDRILQNIQSQLAVTDPTDPNNEFLIQYYQQIGNQFYQQRMEIDRQVLDNMVEEELGRQKAAEVGLTTSDEEINEAIRARLASRLGYVTQAQATSIAGNVVAATATAQTFTPTPVPTSTPTLTVAVTITDTSASDAEEFPTPAPTATRHIITDDEFSQEHAAYIENLTDEVEVREADYRAFVEARLVVETVSDYFAEQVPAEAEQVNISHIRTETEGNAAGVLRRLDDGEEFSLVATQASSNTFTAQEGGELGWFAEGELTARFNQDVEDAAFSLAPGSYSRPISTTLGLQIIRVNERGLQPLNDRQLRTQQQEAYSDWLAEARGSEGVEILWEPEMAPSDPFVEEASGSPGERVPIQQ